MRALVTLVPLSALCGILTAFVFRQLASGDTRQTVNRILAHIIELRLFLDEPRVILKAQRDLLRENLRLFDRIYRAMEKKYPTAKEKLKFNEALKRLLDALVTDLIESTRRRLVEKQIRSLGQVRACRTRLVALGRRMGRENKKVKEFLFARLYTHQNLGAERKRLTGCIRSLFAYYLSRPRRLPPFYFEQSQQEPLHRVVCDYIAGMTDPYLQEQHRKLLGQ